MVVDGLPLAVAKIVTDLRQVAPGRFGAPNPEDGVENRVMILVGVTASIDFGQMFFDALVLLLGKFKAALGHLMQSELFSKSSLTQHVQTFSQTVYRQHPLRLTSTTEVSERCVTVVSALSALTS